MRNKYLVIPSLILTYPHYYRAFSHFNFIFNNITKFFNFRPSWAKLILNGEMNYYGSLFNILKKNELNVLGDIHDIYFSKNIKKYKNIANIEKYYFTLGFKKPKIVDKEYVYKNIINYDCLLISVMSFKKYFNIVKEFKKKKKLVAILDYRDDHEVILNKTKNLSRNISSKYFDIYFKQDLPIGNKSKKFFPLAPVPTKNFKIKNKNFKPLFNFSFFGAQKKWTNDGRRVICEFIDKNFTNNKINLKFIGNEVILKKNMEKILYNSRINLSPHGISWNSNRHAELAKFQRPILMPKPTLKIVGKNFIDNKNCFIYDDFLLKKNYKYRKKMLNKLNFILNNETLLKKVSREYVLTVNKFHTRDARAKQILAILKKNLQ